MANRRRICLGLAVLMLTGLIFTGCGPQEEEPVPLSPLEAYEAAIDPSYGFSIAQAVSAFGTDPALGFRTAGSEAEYAAADYLENEMRVIGLSNVAVEPVAVDGWSFSGASLSYVDPEGAEQTAILAGYPCDIVCDEELPMVYAGKGTKQEIADLDITGKLVLIEAEQRTDWPVGWPAYQAKLAGARAVVAFDVSGYGRTDNNSLAVTGKESDPAAPVFAVSAIHGNRLKRLIEASEGQEISLRFTADSKLEKDSQSFAVTGEISGKTGEVFLICAHYDGFFNSFYGGASGAGAMLGMAKALIDSGFEPERTIRFVLHPAGEWGDADARYARGAGARAVLAKHFEWVEETFALINLDGGVTTNRADGVRIGASRELATFVLDIGDRIPGNPLEGFEVVSPPEGISDDLPYAMAGIPVLHAGYSGTNRAEEEALYTNLDTPDYFYQEELFSYAQRLYGGYVVSFDAMPVIPMDFTTYFKEMIKTVDLEASEKAAGLVSAAGIAVSAAKQLNAVIDETDWSAKDPSAFNLGVKKISRYGFAGLVGLNWQDEQIFAHQRYQANTALLTGAIDALRSGDGNAALEDYLYEVDVNRYAISFNRETYDHFRERVLGPEAGAAWETEMLKDQLDLFDVVNSIYNKMQADEVIDYMAEIEALKEAKSRQQKLLDNTLVQMTKDATYMAEMMEDLE